MESITLALALLLVFGFAVAKLGQRLRLPSVTGYILAGLLLGPSGLDLITQETIGGRLHHFTQIALMLIAFGIGEHLELKPLRRMAKTVGYIGLGETMGAFWLVAGGTFCIALVTQVGRVAWTLTDYMALSTLLGAVSVATAPAATLHVMRELRAAGSLTGTLMAVVAVDDGLAIMIFGVAMSAARHMVGSGSASLMASVGSSVAEILGSLVIGVLTGLLIDFIVHRLNRRGETLAIGLGLLLLGGEGARLLHLSPLLVGMATGFTVVNRDRRDVRLFRTINAFEPPIYVLFFTLAGTHLHLSALAVAGWVGLVYFMLRALGKFLGAKLGARTAQAPGAVPNFLGLALVPQAGVAIGLIFLIQGDAALETFSQTIMPVVLASVVLSELIGPVCARFAIERAGESGIRRVGPELQAKPAGESPAGVLSSPSVQLVPWSWERLTPAPDPQGRVLIGLGTVTTAGSLARMGSLLAHHLRSRITAVKVITSEPDEEKEMEMIFGLAGAEVQNLGYDLTTESVSADTAATGLIAAARQYNTRAIVLGHPRVGTEQGFQRVVESVAREVHCQVVVVRAAGILHTEQILVPLVNPGELEVVKDVAHALAGVGMHRITLFTILPSDALEDDLEEAEEELIRWAEQEGLASLVRCRAIATEARVEAIVDEAAAHDVIVMAASPLRGLRRLFFGSIAEDVAERCRKPMVMVHMPGVRRS